jgi:hypothetical protein
VKSAALFLLTLCFATSATAELGSKRASDPPVLVPWSRVGDLRLGEQRAQVESEYGRSYHVTQGYANVVEGYYTLHGSHVGVTFYGKSVGELSFTTRYYRTSDGFGVGSTIPLGPCHATATSRCEHRWRGFVYNPRLRENRCSCWVKVGTAHASLAPTATNYGKPWFFIYLRDGRVSGFHFALRYVD